MGVNLAKALAKPCFWMTVCISASFAKAQATQIVAVEGFQQNGQEVVRIDLDEPIEFEPVVFTVQSPARISLDFPGVGIETGRQQLELNQGNLRSINLVEGEGRSRAVLNLREASVHQLKRRGKSVFVYLGNVAPVVQQPRDDNIRQPVAYQTRAELKNLDFRRGVDGAGRIILTLPNNETNVDLSQEGNKLVLQLPALALPEHLRKRFDVIDFATPVTHIKAVDSGGGTRIEVEAQGDWEQNSYQADGQYVLELHALKPDANKLTKGLAFSGERLSLNFQNIEVRAVLQVIADFTKFNIITSDSVQGALTLRLQDVPWDQALQIILDAKALGYEKNGNVILVAPKEELESKRQQEYETAQKLRTLEPLSTQFFQLNYARAEDIAKQLTNSNADSSSVDSNESNRFLSERGAAIAEKRTNQLFVTDTASKLEEVVKLVARWDIPVRQVLIEARIVEASDSFGRSLGVRLGGGDGAKRGEERNARRDPGYRATFGSSYSNAYGSTGAGSVDMQGSSFFNFPAALSGSSATAAGFAISLFNAAADRFLNLEISALESSGNGRVISSPRVVTADQNKAIIKQGQQIPYPATAPNGATTISFKDAVMSLEVIPQITPEGNVILNLEINKDSANRMVGGDGDVAIDTKQVRTQVLVENGGTVVIGGIFELVENDVVIKVPFLGDIPIAGNLFKSKTKEYEKKELLIFITPKILSSQNLLGKY